MRRPRLVAAGDGLRLLAHLMAAHAQLRLERLAAMAEHIQLLVHLVAAGEIGRRLSERLRLDLNPGVGLQELLAHIPVRKAQLMRSEMVMCGDCGMNFCPVARHEVCAVVFDTPPSKRALKNGLGKDLFPNLVAKLDKLWQTKHPGKSISSFEQEVSVLEMRSPLSALCNSDILELSLSPIQRIRI